MSSVVGPIHHWMYNKIMILEGMVGEVIAVAKEKGWSDTLEAETEEAVGKTEFGPLEDLIDVDNIHGWIQSLVELEETRFAYVVMRLIKDNEERLTDIQNKLFEHGNEMNVGEGSTAVDVMGNIDGLLLNGMPCDGVVQLVEKRDDLVETTTTQKIHEHFWIEQGGTNDIYDSLIDFYIKGILDGSEFKYERVGSNRKVFL
jgi:hypothetical protein